MTLARTSFPLIVVWLAVAACADATRPALLDEPLDDTPRSPAWRSVGAGTYNSCASTMDGKLHCWGFSLMEDCTRTGCGMDAIPRPVHGTPTAFDTVVSGGGFHCGITSAREAWCWGTIAGGHDVTSLGDGATAVSAVPVRVSIEGPVMTITAGYTHACALTEAGAAFCWGRGREELGAGDDRRASRLPHPVATTIRFRAISAGTTQTCAVSDDGRAYCWGGGYGQRGIRPDRPARPLAGVGTASSADLRYPLCGARSWLIPARPVT